MYAGTMTIDQALEAMKAGRKVANSYFTSNEYLHLVNGVVTSEDGYDFTEWFWDRRPDSRFKYEGLCWLIRE